MISREIRGYQPSEGPCLTVDRPVKNLFADAVRYRNYRLTKKLCWNYDEFKKELNKMTKKTAVYMKDGTFSRKDPVSIISFSQYFNAACDTCNIS